MAAQLPLAFALEPSLLPFAIANGFHLEPTYRNFIFRRIFEKQAECHNIREHANQIVGNVRELMKVDKHMFLSRTVAAEVCMECRTNEAAYLALKILDEAGNLLYSLRDLVHDLLKLFLKTRSITSSSTILILQRLYQDFAPNYPTSAPRLVVLITIFCTTANTGLIYSDDERPASELPIRLTPDILKSKLEYFSLLPVTRGDLMDVLISPWCEKPGPTFQWASDEMGMSEHDLYKLAEEAVIKSLEISCKGKFIRRVTEMYGTIRDRVQTAMEERRLNIEDLPSFWTDNSSSQPTSTLNVSMRPGFGRYRQYVDESRLPLGDLSESGSDSDDVPDEERFVESPQDEDTPSRKELGRIGQDTLSNRIHMDSENSMRPRRRYWHMPPYLISGESDQRSPFPSDSIYVGQWVLETYGPRHPVTAIFMDHAVANSNFKVLELYLAQDSARNRHVPVTLKHFQILAKLGAEPFWQMLREIEHCEFYFTEDDYLRSGHSRGRTARVSLTKGKDGMGSKISPNGVPKVQDQVLENPRKRPRRSATLRQSYFELDSDEDTSEPGDDSVDSSYENGGKRRNIAKNETSLQAWIKHLSGLLRDEEKKYKEKKKLIERDHKGKPASRLSKNNFMKVLASHLPDMRETDRQRRSRHSVGNVKDTDGMARFRESEDDGMYLPTNKRQRFSRDFFLDYY